MKIIIIELFPERRNLKINNKGQTLYYFLVFVMMLVISWAMMLNIARVIINRMSMQNEADNIALSIATHKARVMNRVGGYNYLIGMILSRGTNPNIVQLPSYGTDSVASYVYGDYKLDAGVLDKDVSRMKEAVGRLQKAQERMMQSHAAYQACLVSGYLSKGYLVRISPLCLPTKESSEKYFGLKRNRKEIGYLKTVNRRIGIIRHVVYREPAHGDAKYSWYVTDKNFHRQKIKVTFSKSGNNKRPPLFARLLGIKHPVISVFSAAAIYNTKGAMFPSKESNLTGFPPLPVCVADNLGTLKQIVKVVTDCAKINKLAAEALAVYLAASFGYALSQGAVGQETSPVKNYYDSKDGGWAAHLVPYGSETDERAVKD